MDYKEIKPVHPKGNQSWILIGRTDADIETPVLWPPDAKNWLIGKRPWCWARLKAGGEGDDRGWDGWMASPTLWTWVWASSRSWWWTRKLGVLQSMGSQRIGHDWVTKPNPWAFVYLSCPIVLPETTIIILKRTIRMDIVALGLPFVLHSFQNVFPPAIYCWHWFFIAC